jgi:hypothetical protein
MSGPPPDCVVYARDCACWRCLKFFHLQVTASIFEQDRKALECEPVENKQEAA